MGRYSSCNNGLLTDAYMGGQSAGLFDGQSDHIIILCEPLHCFAAGGKCASEKSNPLHHEEWGENSPYPLKAP